MRALLFTAGSPFARAVRIILDEVGLRYERREEITTPKAEERANATPTLQVPTLCDGETTLWESGLIADYFLSTYPERSAVHLPLAASVTRREFEWSDKLILANVQTLGTAATTISQMKWAGVGHADNEYLSRNAERLPFLMRWLEDRLPNDRQGFFAGDLSVQDIFLVCHLRFIANRPIDLDARLEQFPKVKALVDRLEQRPSFADNPIIWWDPDVTGYAEDGKTPLYD